MGKSLKSLIEYLLYLLVFIILIIGLYQIFSYDEEHIEIADTYPIVEEVSKTIIKLPGLIRDRTKVEGELTIEYKGELKSHLVTLARRGASSYFFMKPQLSVSIINEDGNQISKKIMDMPKGEDWVLNGPYLDRSMIRNYIAYSTAYEIMGYAPRLQFTEVYFDYDGTVVYGGLYTWTEKIRRDNRRVNINRTYNEFEETSFIIERDHQRITELLKVYGNELFLAPNELLTVYPKTTITQSQKNYIEDTVSLFERNLYHDNFNIDGLGYKEHIDMYSFIDYIIISEFFMDTDSGIKSTYFHKDVKGKITAGPVWDFNNAMGNVNFSYKMYDEKGFFMFTRAWFDRLLEDRTFVEALINRYKLLRQTSLREDVLLKRIDQSSDVLKPYVIKDHQQYVVESVNLSFYSFLGTEEDVLSTHLNQILLPEHNYDEEINRLKTFIKDRGNWMDDYIDSLKKWVD